MKSTSPKWRTFWKSMNDLTIRRNRWSVWMKSRSHCMPMSARHYPPNRVARPDRTTNMNAAAPANLFCAVEQKAGRHFTFATPDRSAPEFVKVAVDLALRYPAAKTIHLIVDNLNIHRRKSLTDLLGDEIGAEVWDRFTIHYTPTHGSWLNQAEIENRNGCAPVSRPPPHPRPGHSAPRNPRLESSHESRPRQNQLAIRSPSRQTQVPLRKELFQAVKDLEVCSCG